LIEVDSRLLFAGIGVMVKWCSFTSVLYIFYCSFSFLCVNSNCFRQIMKKAELSLIRRKKYELWHPLLRVFGIFFSYVRLGTGTS